MSASADAPPRDVARVTWKLLAIVGGTAITIGIGIAIGQIVGDGNDCEPPDDVPWSAPRLDAIATSMQRAGHDASWTPVRTAIEAYGERVNTAYSAACAGPSPDAAYECLAPAYRGASKLIEDLRALDETALRRAETTIAGLPPPESCVE